MSIRVLEEKHQAGAIYMTYGYDYVTEAEQYKEMLLMMFHPLGYDTRVTINYERKTITMSRLASCD